MTSQQGLILQSDRFNDLLYICEIILPLNFVQHDVYMCCMFDSVCVHVSNMRLHTITVLVCDYNCA